jgi:hypothetical protein
VKESAQQDRTSGQAAVLSVGQGSTRKSRNFMTGKKKKNWLKSNIGQFIREYTRKAQRGAEPNDRQYDRKIENLIKHMDPRELSELLHDNDENLESETDDKNQKRDPRTQNK